MTWTPLIDVGVCTADIIANGRCHNEHVLLAGETLTHEQLAQRLEHATGEQLKRTIRTEEDLEAAAAGDSILAKHIAVCSCLHSIVQARRHHGQKSALTML